MFRARTVLAFAFVLAGLPACASPAGAQEGNAGAETRTVERTPDASSEDESEPSISELEERARERELGDGEYPYHDQPRDVSGEVTCPDIELVEYEGQVVRYNQPVEINPRFRSRLVRFEKLVSEVAADVYGRAPNRIVHYGGHDCKTVGGNGEKLSEHAFGHAIDVAGFDFEAVGDERAEDLEVEEAGEAFEVRVGEHWEASEGFDARHAEFLRRLADALERRGPFSTMLGPGYPGHDEIFHFDFGPEFFFRL